LYTGFPIWSVDAIEGNGVRTVLIEDVSGHCHVWTARFLQGEVW
jgi:hypothetical protein